MMYYNNNRERIISLFLEWLCTKPLLMIWKYIRETYHFLRLKMPMYQCNCIIKLAAVNLLAVSEIAQ